MRKRAVQRLGKYKDDRAVSVLHSILLSSYEDLEIRCVAAGSLARHGGAGAVHALSLALNSSSPPPVWISAATALQSLAWTPPDAATEVYMLAATGRWAEVPSKGIGGVPALASMVVADEDYRANAVRALKEIGGEASVWPLVRFAAAHPKGASNDLARATIHELGPATVVSAIHDHLQHDELPPEREVAYALTLLQMYADLTQSLLDGFARVFGRFFGEAREAALQSIMGILRMRARGRTQTDPEQRAVYQALEQLLNRNTFSSFGYSSTDPILCNGPSGERAFIEGLRCRKGHSFHYHRDGVYRGECATCHNTMIDKYTLSCECNGSRVELYFCMYHPQAPLQPPPQGLLRDW